LPLEPATFQRAIAETTGVGLLRVGHPFVNALETMVRTDDRGSAFAMWRHSPGITPTPQLFFRFDFFVEADLGHAESRLGLAMTSIQALRRRADHAFPVEYRTVWLDSDLEIVSTVRLLNVLGFPFSKTARRDGGRDVNVRMERWGKVDSLVPVGDWPELCYRARDKATNIVTTDPDFRERCLQHTSRILDATRRVDDVLKNRISRLKGKARESEVRMAALEVSMGETIAQSIEHPTVRLDSVGAIFLSPRPF
jgi:ATP-dependent helicase HepA